MDEAHAAVVAGADYLGVGPIYATQGKSDAGQPVGPSLLTEIARRYTTPLIAIGGITATNTREIIHAGATGIAVITAVVNAEDVAAATHTLVKALGPVHDLM
jgi:thiamine-phosphate pyrophosphorylase